MTNLEYLVQSNADLQTTETSLSRQNDFRGIYSSLDYANP